MLIFFRNIFTNDYFLHLIIEIHFYILIFISRRKPRKISVIKKIKLLLIFARNSLIKACAIQVLPMQYIWHNKFISNNNKLLCTCSITNAQHCTFSAHCVLCMHACGRKSDLVGTYDLWSQLGFPASPSILSKKEFKQIAL